MNNSWEGKTIKYYLLNLYLYFFFLVFIFIIMLQIWSIENLILIWIQLDRFILVI